MKVSEILTEGSEECIAQNISDIFHESYEDIDGVLSMGLDEILSIMQGITAKQNEAQFGKEEDILRRFLELEDGETIYVPKQSRQELEQLEDVLRSGEGNTMQVITTIQKFARMLGKQATTESDWKGSDEYGAAMQQAQEVCGQGDEYARRGVNRSDFV